MFCLLVIPPSLNGKSPKKTKSEVFKPLQVFDSETFLFLGTHCNEPSFRDDKWFLPRHRYHLIEPPLTYDYYPLYSESVRFKVTCNGDYDSADGNKDWNQLQVFQTHCNPESETLTAYIGSECYAMEWIPKPQTVDYSSLTDKEVTIYDADYIVVSSLGDGRGFDDYDVPNYIEKTQVEPMRKGLIQLWKLEAGKLECVACFANDHGLIWALEAPKGGTSYCPINGRLSLIAAAFDNGYVRIFSIPLPEDLTVSRTIDQHLPPIFNFPPVAVLEPPFTSHIVARCLSWSWCDQQKCLAVGYGNGLANYYNLSTNSSLLMSRDDTNVTILKPSKTWIAHGAMVSAIQILPLPGSKTVVTGSWDRNIKLWNVRQPRLLAIPLLHRSVVHCLTVSLYYLGGFFITLDDTFLASNQSVVTFKQIYEEGQRSSVENRSLYTIPFDTSNVYSLSISLYFNSILVSDNSGNSILQNNFRAKHEKSTRRKLSDLLPIFTSQLRRLVSSHVTQDANSNASEPMDKSGPSLSIAKSTVTNVKKKASGKKGAQKEKKTTKSNFIDLRTTSDNYLVDKNEPRARSYMEMSSQYGIIFNDFTVNKMEAELTSTVAKFREASNLKRARLTDYPLTSISKTLWSPNKSTCHMLANVLHSGLIRVSCIAKGFIGGEMTSKKKPKSAATVSPVSTPPSTPPPPTPPPPTPPPPQPSTPPPTTTTRPRRTVKRKSEVEPRETRTRKRSVPSTSS